ncbi:hypothetical protein [Plastoroseomonas hellenica]|uniref:hypothetical protein n=1 Tax=Plastoroseomonas hellenica TaxID=2687306 RepID=UPI001BA4E45B|nr:hypothetical protein [Plastoroseomonas hellenica]MBR0643026.1 hypothetical protein [Plastoroseomonas hellenica]
MNAHPQRTATLMALAATLGLVGVMVLDGWWMLPALLLAGLPPAAGLLGYCRTRARPRQPPAA